MKHFFITGASSGIGKSMADQLIPHHRVTGISRNEFHRHRNYTHVKLDLADINAVTAFQFLPGANAEEFILINNAGMIGEIKRVGEISQTSLVKTVNVNLTSLMILCNTFIGQVNAAGKKALIINISSGAATHPIGSWAAYCASKAAVDMFTLTLAEELKESQNNRIHAFSVYPGIVDTAMQQHIRTSDPKDFPSVERFRKYKNEGSLLTAGLVAERIINKFIGSVLPSETILDVRNFT